MFLKYQIPPPCYRRVEQKMKKEKETRVSADLAGVGVSVHDIETDESLVQRGEVASTRRGEGFPARRRRIVRGNKSKVRRRSR